jgi:DNA polymerase III subunit beta
MKFAMHCTALSETIAAAITSLPTRATTPILGGVLVEALVGAVSFSSFNYDRATTRTVAADVTDTDTAVVSGRLLATVGASLPKRGEATVEANDAGMVITAGATVFRLPMMETQDYPVLPVIEPEHAIGSVNCREFAEAAKIVGGLAATDPMPANLTYLNLECEPGSLWLCATDRYVLGRRRLDWSGTTDAVINVAAADMLALVKALDDPTAETVELLWNGNMFGLRTPSSSPTSRTCSSRPNSRPPPPSPYRT